MRISKHALERYALRYKDFDMSGFMSTAEIVKEQRRKGRVEITMKNDTDTLRMITTPDKACVVTFLPPEDIPRE